MVNSCQGELINKALEIALGAHDGQKRKGSGKPYIIHPIEVGMTLSRFTQDEEIIAAGILHDTLEDTDLTYDDLFNLFGKRVADLVVSSSEELKDRKNTPWKKRKIHTLNFLKNAGEDVKLISCSDKLSNIKSFIRDYKKNGDNIWEKFNQKDKNEHKWYYEELLISLADMENKQLYNEFVECVKKMFD